MYHKYNMSVIIGQVFVKHHVRRV